MMKFSRTEKILAPVTAGALLLSGCSTEVKAPHAEPDAAMTELANAYTSCKVTNVEVVTPKTAPQGQPNRFGGIIKVSVDAKQNSMAANANPSSAVQYTHPTFTVHGDGWDYAGQPEDRSDQITQLLYTDILKFSVPRKVQEHITVSARAKGEETTTLEGPIKEDLYYFCGAVAVDIDPAAHEIIDAYTIPESMMPEPIPKQAQIKISIP